MIKLLVLADDLTGALDTGIQFGSETSAVVLCSDSGIGINETEIKTVSEKLEVLIIDTESRHLDAKEAYRRVFNLVQMARQIHIPYIYKKTDSGMRGNIGAELEACIDAYGGSIHFIPAFPQIGRVTVDGIQYIDGIPVAESVFGKDPLNPVKYSSVNQIIGLQSTVACHVMNKVNNNGKADEIFLYDCQSQDDLQKIALDLKNDEDAHLFAGCAAFAAMMHEMLNLKKPIIEKAQLRDSLLIVCGSVNPVTLKQLDMAERYGAIRICLTNQQKLEENYYESSMGKYYISRIKKLAENSVCTIIESVTDIDGESTAHYASLNCIDAEEICQRISRNLGIILKKLLESGLKKTLLVTGGDTLQSFMTSIGVHQLSPICELYPGVVLSRIKYKGEKFDLISKSGGFGSEELFLNIQNIISKRGEELCISQL